jgi:hypothetical protein
MLEEVKINMRALILALLLFLSLGLAGAVTVGTPTFNFGPEPGFMNPGTIQAGDLYATDDALIGDDAQVLGDLSVAGSISATGGSIAAGIISEYLTTAGISNVGVLFSTGTTQLHGNTFLDYTHFNGSIAVYGSENFGNNKGATAKFDHIVVNDTTIQNSIAGGLNVGGALNVGSTLTMNSSQALVVTSADKLTIAGNIIAKEVVLTFPFGFNSTNSTWFAANNGWEVTKVEEAHMTKQSSTAEPATIDLTICNSGEAPASGDSVISAPVDLRATNNVLQTSTLSATKTLADGDWLAVVFRGYRTGFAGGSLTVHMKRV